MLCSRPLRGLRLVAMALRLACLKRSDLPELLVLQDRSGSHSQANLNRQLHIVDRVFHIWTACIPQQRSQPPSQHSAGFLHSFHELFER